MKALLVKGLGDDLGVRARGGDYLPIFACRRFVGYGCACGGLRGLRLWLGRLGFFRRRGGGGVRVGRRGVRWGRVGFGGGAAAVLWRPGGAGARGRPPPPPPHPPPALVRPRPT